MLFLDLLKSAVLQKVHFELISKQLVQILICLLSRMIQHRILKFIFTNYASICAGEGAKRPAPSNGIASVELIALEISSAFVRKKHHLSPDGVLG